MQRWLAVLGFLLSACNGPSPHFRGAEPVRVSIDGSTFDVRVRGNLAEAARVNPQYAPRLGPIGARAGRAMAQVSGCRVEHVIGDAALILGLLNCGPDAPDWDKWLRKGTGRYSCMEVDRWTSPGGGIEYTDFECDPI